MGGAQHIDKQSADEPIQITLCLHQQSHSVCSYSMVTSVMAILPLISQHASAKEMRRLTVMTVKPGNLLFGHRPLRGNNGLFKMAIVKMKIFVIQFH